MILRLLFLIFISCSVFAQETTLLSKIESFRESDIKNKVKADRINYWYNSVDKYGFKKINKEKYDFVFRYWQDGLLIDLTKKDSVFKGYVYNFITGIKYNKEEKIYIQIDTLNQIDTELIYNHIITSDVRGIPSSEDILNWKRNYHYAPSCNIEFFNEKGYIFNDFITLDDQKEFTESNTIREFLKTLKVLANIKILGHNFHDNIPYDCYYIQEGIHICQVLSKKEYRIRKRKEKAKKLLR